jgi:hypothetical protein
MDSVRAVVWTAVACVALGGRPALAQTTPSVVAGGAVELSIGGAQFIDDGAIGHAVVGGSSRWYFTPRVAIGPEIAYMAGARGERDLFVTGNLTFDFRRRTSIDRPAVVPYLVAGAGLFQHRDLLAGRSFVSREGAFTAGGGVRVWLSRVVFVAAEARTGWEPHISYSGHVGVGFGQ